MLRIELHCHTVFSKDSIARLEHVLATARKKGLDRLAITDHNTIAGALLAKEMDPERVIIGEEVSTTKGELLAFFVTEEVPQYLPPEEAISHLKDQGALIGVSHPFDRFRQGHWERPDLERIAHLVDCIEVFNARCLLPSDNRFAAAFARQYGLLGTVGSDAHTSFEIGKAIMLLPEFDNAIEMRQALSKAQVDTALFPPWIHLTSRFAVWQKTLRAIK